MISVTAAIYRAIYVAKDAIQSFPFKQTAEKVKAACLFFWSSFYDEPKQAEPQEDWEIIELAPTRQPRSFSVV